VAVAWVAWAVWVEWAAWACSRHHGGDLFALLRTYSLLKFKEKTPFARGFFAFAQTLREDDMNITIYFRNGLQLQLDTTFGEELDRRLTKYLREPRPDNRASSISYSEGGTHNCTLMVDLESVIAIQRR
jgi:hypothetical protein